MRQLEKKSLTEMEEILSNGIDQPDFLVDLFPSCVQKEVDFYSKNFKWPLSEEIEKRQLEPYVWLKENEDHNFKVYCTFNSKPKS